MGLDILDFIKERGGDPEKIKKSQRARSAPEEAVDEVIALYEDHRKSEQYIGILFANHSLIHPAAYNAAQTGTEINKTQKEIGLKKKVGSGAWRAHVLDDCLFSQLEQGECGRPSSEEDRPRKAKEGYAGVCR